MNINYCYFSCTFLNHQFLYYNSEYFSYFLSIKRSNGKQMFQSKFEKFKIASKIFKNKRSLYHKNPSSWIKIRPEGVNRIINQNPFNEPSLYTLPLSLYLYPWKCLLNMAINLILIIFLRLVWKLPHLLSKSLILKIGRGEL